MGHTLSISFGLLCQSCRILRRKRFFLTKEDEVAPVLLRRTDYMFRADLLFVVFFPHIYAWPWFQRWVIEKLPTFMVKRLFLLDRFMSFKPMFLIGRSASTLCFRFPVCFFCNPLVKWAQSPTNLLCSPGCRRPENSLLTNICVPTSPSTWSKKINKEFIISMRLISVPLFAPMAKG